MYTIKIIYKTGRIAFDYKQYETKNAAIRRALRRYHRNRGVLSVEIWETAKIPAMYL